MLKEKISPFIDKIRLIDGVEVFAHVSRDGNITGKYPDRELKEPGFGGLLAIILASSESIGGIVNLKSLESVVIRTQDISGMIAGAMERFLIAANLKDGDDLLKVHNQMIAVGRTIGEVM